MAYPTKKGYEFIGWFTNAEKTNSITKIQVGTTNSITEWAKFEILNYDIEYVIDSTKVVYDK